MQRELLRSRHLGQVDLVVVGVVVDREDNLGSAFVVVLGCIEAWPEDSTEAAALAGDNQG